MPLPGRGYPVLIGEGALELLLPMLKGHSGGVAVADRAVAGWAAGLGLPVLEVEGGEGLKSLEGVRGILAFLEERRVDRAGCLVAVGGGTVGDAAGFAAAVWLRGVALYQVPTTLLAMVDSAIGGKTGVNTALGKNMVGVFWQPRAVVADLRSLASLPAADVGDAFGEVVKYGLAMDAGLLGLVEERADALLAASPEALEPVVARCAALKAEVVVEDEEDLSGRRAILNYGHTAGHAFEAASAYRLRHGRAVAHGLRVAARLGVAAGAAPALVVEVTDRALARFGLPGPPPPGVGLEDLLAGLAGDKKSVGGRPRWVLPRAVGRVEAGRQVEAVLVREVLARYLEEAS
ncbi:MAG: 3-dehydroquinate synthase [Candidatus Dormibacterales bacterium]